MRHSFRWFVLALAVLAVLFSGAAQDRDIDILRAADTRDAAALRALLAGENSHALYHSALAAASLQDTSLTAALAVLLVHPADSVRTAAAFALGQTGVVLDSAGRRGIAALLAERLVRETNTGSLCALIEALGKTGDRQTLGVLLALRPRPVPDEVDGEIALSIGRMAYRGTKTREATAYAVRLLDLAAGPGRWKPAYALRRIGDREFLDEHVSRIAAAAQDPDPDVRMECALAMGKVNNRRVAMLTLLNLASGDPDWRVRVNALKALGGIEPSASPEAVGAVIQAVEDTNRHVALAALAVLPAMHLAGTEQGRTARALLETLLADRSGRVPAHEQREAAVTLARVFGADVYPVIAALKEGGGGRRIACAAALAEIPLEDARNDLMALARDPDPRLASAAIEALTASVHRAGLTALEKDRVRATLTSTLRSDDIAVLAASAAGLADSALVERHSVTDLLVTLQRLRLPAQAEAVAAIAEALGILNDRIAVPSLVALAGETEPVVARAAVKAIEAITGKPHGHLLRLRRPAPDSSTAPDMDLLAWVEAHPEIDVRTSRGTFTIRLLPGQAPMTCMAIATLVRKGFYSRLTFHRVVPNFVVQGGDPRGDGWGGPGLTLRSEFGMVHYERGTVGIASSGKDTEGSQFFVTHSRQPHLDGRYTVIGRVIAGMEVVDRLQIGDRIEAMEFVEPAAQGRQE